VRLQQLKMACMVNIKTICWLAFVGQVEDHHYACDGNEADGPLEDETVSVGTIRDFKTELGHIGILKRNKVVVLTQAVVS